MEYTELQNALLFKSAIKNTEEFVLERKSISLTPSAVRSGGDDEVDQNYRVSNQHTVEPEHSFVQTLRDITEFANENYFKVNVSEYCNENHFIEYNVGGKFRYHNDLVWRHRVKDLDKTNIRKLSTICLLNDDYTGGKLALFFRGKRYSFNFSRGDVLVFPAFVFHQVDPIDSGTRYSIISWSTGVF